MNRTYFYWIGALTLLGLIFIIKFMSKGTPSPPSPQDMAVRPVSPFRSYIFATGIVEASSENILIGSPVNRIVSKVEVKVGEKVRKHQVLFRLESRDLEASLQTSRIAYEEAIANLQKLESLPRQEDMSAALALLKAAEIEHALAKSQFERVDGLQSSGAMSDEEVMRRHFAAENAEAKFQQVQADFEKIKSGAWQPDIEIAKLKVNLAKADMEAIQTSIQRTVITSPINATVLQIKIHEGEFPPTDPSSSPSMIIGDVDVLHLRVNINQFDASHFNQEAPAVAFSQGNAHLNFPLQFVRLEPYFVNKQHLTNNITETIDTRVLQAIYSFKDGIQGIFVGQQMDVFIETPGL